MHICRVGGVPTWAATHLNIHAYKDIETIVLIISNLTDSILESKS